MPTATKPDISSIIHAYAFSTADKERLATLLAQSYLLAKAQAYQKAVKTTEHIARIRHPWTPGKSDVASAQQWATKQVESIASTYQELLQHTLEGALAQEERGIVDAVGKAVRAVKEWFKGFLPWKTKQIADYTWNKGGNDGTSEWIEDVQGDDVEWVEGEDSSVQDLSRFAILILPEVSSNDECADWAGQQVPIEQAADVPNFPIHAFCPHYTTIIVV